MIMIMNRNKTLVKGATANSNNSKFAKEIPR